MHPARAVILVLGLAVFIVGVYLLFFQADLDRWVSVGILTAGIVIFIGIVIMSFAGSAPADRNTEDHQETHEREVVREPRRGGGGGAAREHRYRR